MKPRITTALTPLTLLTLITLLWFSPVHSQTSDFYGARRARLLEKTGQGTVILANNGGQDYVATSGENMNFYYLTGITTLNAIMVIDGKTGKSTVYLPSGRRGEPEPAPAGLEAKTSEDFPRDLPRLIAGNPVIWIEMNQLKLLEQGGFGLARMEAIHNITPVINGMRPVKDEHEIALIKKSAQINAQGLKEVMKAAEPGMNEKDFELILDYTFKKNGSTGYSFGIQAASGPNSTSVHYGKNDRTTEPGDMMVFDIGAEYQYYTADISRSFPVSGKFSKEQREIYEVVLNAQKAAIDLMKPGRRITEAYDIVPRELNKGLLKLGLLTDTTQAWQKRIWMQHGWGHHIGLQVHDVSAPYDPENPEILVPGMIYTMEPGLYFPQNYLRTDGPANPRIPEAEWKAFLEKVYPVFQKYVNIGVRIEDDVLITPDGNEIISGDVPKEIAEIEALMKQKSMFN